MHVVKGGEVVEGGEVVGKEDQMVALGLREEKRGEEGEESGGCCCSLGSWRSEDFRVFFSICMIRIGPDYRRVKIPTRARPCKTV